MDPLSNPILSIFLQVLLDLMPSENHANLAYIIKFCIDILTHSNDNKMTVKSISIVLGVNLLKRGGGGGEKGGAGGKQGAGSDKGGGNRHEGADEEIGKVEEHVAYFERLRDTSYVNLLVQILIENHQYFFGEFKPHYRTIFDFPKSETEKIKDSGSVNEA